MLRSPVGVAVLRVSDDPRWASFTFLVGFAGVVDADELDVEVRVDDDVDDAVLPWEADDDPGRGAEDVCSGEADVGAAVVAGCSDWYSQTRLKQSTSIPLVGSRWSGLPSL